MSTATRSTRQRSNHLVGGRCNSSWGRSWRKDATSSAHTLCNVSARLLFPPRCSLQQRLTLQSAVPRWQVLLERLRRQARVPRRDSRGHCVPGVFRGDARPVGGVGASARAPSQQRGGHAAGGTPRGRRRWGCVLPRSTLQLRPARLRRSAALGGLRSACLSLQAWCSLPTAALSSRTASTSPSSCACPTWTHSCSRCVGPS
jgi:hypothetical protein